MLFPRKSETRHVQDLCGVWRFKVDFKNEGTRKKWYDRPLTRAVKIPVPASYNDLFKDAAIRDHVGEVWYEREFRVPKIWKGKRIVLRFGSVTHHARVWVNGKSVGRHKGGFLPFECDVSRVVHYRRPNRVTVAVSNVLDWTTLPPGEVRRTGSGQKFQEYWFDFFNYAGIHRPVKLIAMPRTYMKDVRITTNIRGIEGVVSYELDAKGDFSSASVRCLDVRGRAVASSQGMEGTMRMNRPRLWAPGRPYLYKLEASLWDEDGNLIDRVRVPFGIRTIRISKRQFFINGKAFHFKGFGKHEDSVARGRGFDETLNRKDVRLMKSIGANSFRTSHYPYSEEWLNLADEKGIVVIGEAPAVGMNFLGAGEKVFTRKRVGSATLKHHLEVMRDMIARDRNHPSIVMWSVSNEPASQEQRATPYFKAVARESRRLDPTRPITLVTCAGVREDRVMRFFDVLCINRYFGWYVNPGQLDEIEPALEKDLRAWFRRFKKPVLLSEFGADAIAGFHGAPPVMFTEEYQREVIDRCCRVLDRLNFVIGEHVWNFADFATKQNVFRVGGNRKGVFTRDRRPKLVANFLRNRWK